MSTDAILFFGYSLGLLYASQLDESLVDEDEIREAFIEQLGPDIDDSPVEVILFGPKESREIGIAVRGMTERAVNFGPKSLGRVNLLCPVDCEAIESEAMAFARWAGIPWKWADVGWQLVVVEA